MTILARYPHGTKFLVVHAIGNPWESVRIAAAEALKQLPREESVPLLLACAPFPAKFACSLLVSGGIVRQNTLSTCKDWTPMPAFSTPIRCSVLRVSVPPTT